MAVLVMAGTIAVCTAMFALVVKALLDQFLRAQRGLLEAATMQSGSVDTALSLQNTRLATHDGRLSMLEMEQQETTVWKAQTEARLRALEPRR